MNENRTANALPGRTGSKADHQTQQEIMRRTADAGPGASIVHTHTGAFIETKRQRGQVGHPWKVSAKGDATVRIAPGQAFHWSIEGISSGAAMINAVTYAGTQSFTVTETGTSYIYAKITIGTPQVVGQTSNRQLTSTVAIVNSADAPADLVTGAFVFLLLATVSKSGDVVTVTKQHLEHNPIFSVQDAPLHPWQVTENGDDTVDIAPGELLYWEPNGTGSFPNEPHTANAETYAGETFEITASGTLYMVIPAGYAEVSDDGAINSLVYVPVSSLSVELNPSASGTTLYIPIADVTLAAGVATVTRQHLTHNPLLELGYSYLDSP